MLLPTFNLLEKSVEVSVAVTRPLAALDHIELVQGEGDGSRQTFYLNKRNSVFVLNNICFVSITCPFSSPSGIGVYLSKSGAMRSG